MGGSVKPFCAIPGICLTTVSSVCICPKDIYTQMQGVMEIGKAVALELGRLNQPVVTLYQTSIIVFKLYKAGAYRKEKLVHLRKTQAKRSDCMRVLADLVKQGVLEYSRAPRHGEVFSILGREGGPAEDVACAIDPFAYISHLSAMEWHGLTDRVGQVLTYSSPPPKRWQEFAWQQMKKDIGSDLIQNYLTQDLPRLKRIAFKSIGRSRIHRYLSEHLGAFGAVQDRSLRVSTIGRTFLDMIREPNLCGGIYHVLEVYRQHAPRYLTLIVDEIDRHGTKIDKVRAGYILAEREKLVDARLEGWKRFAQRGGSRKLYARGPYSPEYSEAWSLSINVEG